MVDLSTLHIFTIFSMIMMWTNFFLTYKSDPGCVDARSPLPSMSSLAGVLGSSYDSALESLGLETDNLGNAGSPPTGTGPNLCHSCHLSKPLRSKHDRVTRKCVLMFDHYCPFIGNAIGLLNYRYFFLYVVFHCMSVSGFIVTCSIYLHRTGFDFLTVLLLIYVGSFLIPGIFMLHYHVQLIYKNLTTNEHQNLWRYKYLQTPDGRYRNPWDKGGMHNFYSRIIAPGEETYELREGGRRDAQGGDKERLIDDNIV